MVFNREKNRRVYSLRSWLGSRVISAVSKRVLDARKSMLFSRMVRSNRACSIPMISVLIWLRWRMNSFWRAKSEKRIRKRKNEMAVMKKPFFVECFFRQKPKVGASEAVNFVAGQMRVLRTNARKRRFDKSDSLN